MLGYAWRVLTRHRSLWGPTTACALVAALPGVLVATVLSPSLTALLLSGDPVVAYRLLPDPLVSGGITGALAWIGVVATSIVVVAAWTRLYIAALWVSLEDRDTSLRAALKDTKGRWRTAFAIHLEALVAVGTVLCATGFLFFIGPAGGGGGTGAFLVITIVLLFRSVVRVASTLALRAAAFDNVDHQTAWRRGFEIMHIRRSEAIAAWMMLVAIGAALWIGGRLITPVLQETLLAYPHNSGYTTARELVQLIYAVPIEAFLLALSIGVWTAVYLGGDALRETPPARERSGADPWTIRALALLVLLVLIGNGIPTAIDARYDRSIDRGRAAVEEREITPEDAVRSPVDIAGPSGNAYTVNATLNDDDLTWTTRIDYTNETAASMNDIGIHVYPAAYTRSVEDLPLARDLAANDISGSFTRLASAGEFEVVALSVDGSSADHTRDETAVLVKLDASLMPGRTVEIEVRLRAKLPRYPERFGIWENQTLLGNWIPVVAQREGGSWRLDEYGPVGDPFFSSVADYDITFDVPEREQIVGTGILTSVEEASPGRRTWHFVAHEVRDAAFVVGPFLRGLEQNVGKVIVRSWFDADQRLEGSETLTTAVSAMEHFVTAYGDLPFDEAEVVETGGSFGGMEYPGIVFISDAEASLQGLPLIPELLEHSGFNHAIRTYVTGHELAHQWWYAAVGNDQVREPWLDEALAEISVREWLAKVEGDTDTFLMTNLTSEVVPRRAVLGAGIDDFGTNAGYTDAVSLEGAAVLFQLKGTLGNERFAELLRDYYDRNLQGIGTTESFLETLREVGGQAAVDELLEYL